MQTCIIYGNPVKDEKFESYLASLKKSIPEKCGLSIFNLAEMNIHQCRGCWNCWVKTPGRCIFKDDMEKIYPTVMESNLLIFASPMVAGFISGTLKTAMDRLIPLVLPNISIFKNECHHKKRYSNYPYLGLLLSTEKATDPEDLKNVKNVFERLAINFHSDLLFMKLTSQQDTKKVVYEACHF